MKRLRKQITSVKEHSRHILVSVKNPTGITIVDQHVRRLPGSFLDASEIQKIAENYDKRNIKYPNPNNLGYPDGNKYDELIAIWTDYFNKKFSSKFTLNPDVVKALIGSESSFDANPKRNKKAHGLTQITDSTLRILQDPHGESKEFIFMKIARKNLKDSAIAIPLAIRWLYRKKTMAEGKLDREVTAEEIILEYKGLLKSESNFKKEAVKNFNDKYNQLKKK
jgi:hypothetical protein